ncbi:hypothetical protein GCM10010297_23260 [Streptomyces malachitofuscus]|nr:hypothetical protein GCM10010297_23260 [Streptomyces malachitofuscus]
MPGGRDGGGPRAHPLGRPEGAIPAAGVRAGSGASVSRPRTARGGVRAGHRGESGRWEPPDGAYRGAWLSALLRSMSRAVG